MPFSALGGRHADISWSMDKSPSFSHHDDPLDRWSGYEATEESGVTRGWDPNLDLNETQQREAKQQHEKWVEDGGPFDSRNRLGPLKPHTVMVTAREGPKPATHSYVRIKDEKAYTGPDATDGYCAKTGNAVSPLQPRARMSCCPHAQVLRATSIFA